MLELWIPFFSSGILCYSSRIYLVLLYFSVSSLNISFCSCVMFLNSYHCLSMFSCSSLSLFRTIILPVFRHFVDLHFFRGRLLEVYWVLLVVSYFLDFWCFLFPLHWCHAESESKSPFPVLIKKVPLSVGVDVSSRFGGEAQWCSS